MADLFFGADRLDQLIGDLLRIAVLNADPVDARNLCQLVKQLRKHFLSIKINTVKSCLLSHQDQFPYALVSQLVCLF